MGAKRFDCLGDWSRWGQMIPLRCRECGHQGEIDPTALLLKWGYGRSLESMPFSCRECGAVGRKNIAVGVTARIFDREAEDVRRRHRRR